jgi:hypothetical protein
MQQVVGSRLLWQARPAHDRAARSVYEPRVSGGGGRVPGVYAQLLSLVARHPDRLPCSSCGDIACCAAALCAWSRLFSLGDTKRSAYFARNQEGSIVAGRGILHPILRQRKGKLIGRVGKAEAASSTGMPERAHPPAYC